MRTNDHKMIETVKLKYVLKKPNKKARGNPIHCTIYDLHHEPLPSSTINENRYPK